MHRQRGNVGQLLAHELALEVLFRPSPPATCQKESSSPQLPRLDTHTPCMHAGRCNCYSCIYPHKNMIAVPGKVLLWGWGLDVRVSEKPASL